MATVLLIRHGQSTANAEGILAGWTPGVTLNTTGREQADAVVRHVTAACEPVRIVSSPLQRCQETAEPLARAVGLPITTLDGLAECQYGSWTGRKLTDLTHEALWDQVQRHPSSVRFPDGDDFAGEAMVEMASRAVTSIRRTDADVTAAYGEDAVWCAFSHGDVIKAIAADALGMHLDSFQRIMCSPGSVTVIRYTAERPYVVVLNASGPLPTLRALGSRGGAVVGGESSVPSTAGTGN